MRGNDYKSIEETNVCKKLKKCKHEEVVDHRLGIV
jgi:hypothetical protein